MARRIRLHAGIYYGRKIRGRDRCLNGLFGFLLGSAGEQLSDTENLPHSRLGGIPRDDQYQPGENKNKGKHGEWQLKISGRPTPRRL